MSEIVDRRWLHGTLAAILVAGFGARIGYVLSQPATDPAYARPILDGAYYLDWARSVASGSGGPGGAYYLAPLYPHLLAGFLYLFGENFTLLYLLQHFLGVATAGLLAWATRRAAGEAASVATAGLFLLYHPALFFASRPLGEATALLLLALGLALVGGASAPAAGAAGLALGLASLARPNLLLIPGAWILMEALLRRWTRAALLGLGLVVAILPVALVNLARSGHLVLVSANSGITLYHGNGPTALGIYAPAEGLSGALSLQREEATRLARARSALDLDPVGADAWWGREALRVRLEDPLGTARLLARRCLLLVDNHEYGLDYAPALDGNPWRWVAPVPFGLMLGLVVAGLILRGIGGAGGRPVWTAVLASAVTPAVFYASCRYRLPLTTLLTVPAGAGLSALLGLTGNPRPGRRVLALGLGSLSLAISLLVFSRDLSRADEAGSLANRAVSYKQAGDLASATRDLERALRLEPGSAPAWYNLGTVLEATGSAGEAERAYRAALSLDPSQAEAAGNLGALLIHGGSSAEAVAILRRALAGRPGHAVCWTNLVIALASLGDVAGAREAASEAARAGVALEPALLEDIGAQPAQGNPGGKESS